MIFQSSCFILYFIFSINSVVSMKFSIMTSPRYYDVTHFLTDSNENWTAYVKLNSKIFLFVELFWFSEYLLNSENKYSENSVYCTVTLHLSPIPFGLPIRVGSVRDTSFTYLRIIFQHTKKKKSFYQKWWKPGSIPIIPPFGPPFGGF